MKKNSKHTAEAKEKMRLANLGKHFSPLTEIKKGQKMTEATKKKMSDRMKKNGSPWNIGKEPWNKGLTIADERVKRNVESLIKSNKGQTKIPWNKNKKGLQKSTPESRLKTSLKLRGKNAPNWQGGKTKLDKTIRDNLDYRLWRESIFARDNWTCQDCGARGLKLNAHHIKAFAKHKELRFAIDNGITLCKSCHQERHTHKF